AMNYAGLGEEAGTEDLVEYVEQRQSLNTQGGSSVDIASMSPPLQLYTYLFRPMPFEARSIFALAASIDNLVLLFLVLAGFTKIITSQRRLPGTRSVLWLYALFAWLILAMTTANLGISVRQKWMFAPMLIYLFLSALGKRRSPRPMQRHHVGRQVGGLPPGTLSVSEATIPTVRQP